MARNRHNITTALDISKKLFTWDAKLHRDSFTKHLKNYLDQEKLSDIDRCEVLNILENIMYVVTDKRRYVGYDERTAKNPDATKEAIDRIYDIKTVRNGIFYRDDWKTTWNYERQPHNKEIADELLQLKIRLHEEIMVVKNDIKLCKEFIKANFEEPVIKSLAPPRVATRRNSDTATISKKLGYSPRVTNSATLPRSKSSTTLNQKKNVIVRRRGSTTSLLDELESTKERPVASVLLGDSVFDQISQKRLVNDNRKVEAFCKSHYFIENGFEKLTDYVISNSSVEVTNVCILLGGNNLEQRTAPPTDLASIMLNHVKDLLKRITGQIYIYALLPRLDNATLDRNISHFNSQLASMLFQSRLQRVIFVQNVVPREAKCFQADGKSLAGSGLNKIMRAVRKNMMGER